MGSEDMSELCGPGPDARFCATFWSQAAELDAAKAALADGHSRLTGRIAELVSEGNSLREQLTAVTDERDQLSEHLAVTRERVRQLAARLELSAAATEPSKKSDIERQCARRLGDIASQDVPAMVGAGTEHLLDPANPAAWQRVADVTAEGR